MHYNFKSKYYFINKLNTKNIDKLDNLTTVIYRNYSVKNIDKKLIIEIKKYCKKKRIKFYLANNINLAINLNLDGKTLGIVDKVDGNGFQDWIFSGQIAIPIVDKHIKNVDLFNGKILVDWEESWK